MELSRGPLFAALGATATAWVVAAVLSGAAARLLGRAGLCALNHRGRVVPQGAGVVLPLANAAGLGVLLLAGVLAPVRVWPGVAGCFALGLTGLLDDATGAGEPRGWAGHGRALLAGNLTAGGFKALTGLGLGTLLGLSAVGWQGAAAIIFGPNAVNTLDTRPGRAALALVVAAGLLISTRGVAALLPLLPMLAAVAGVWSGERRECLMWGDAGANAAGFALAWAWALAGPGPAAAFALVAAGLVAVGDRVHLSRLPGVHGHLSWVLPARRR